jgi:hypothetical protein
MQNAWPRGTTCGVDVHVAGISSNMLKDVEPLYKWTFTVHRMTRMEAMLRMKDTFLLDVVTVTECQPHSLEYILNNK